MTVLTKPSAIIKKPEINEVPLVDKTICDEEKIEIHPNPEWHKYSIRGVMCFALILLAILGISGGLMLCHEMFKPTTVRRYQGFCYVPTTTEFKEMMDPDLRTLPLHWAAGDVQLVSADERDGLADALREELDISDSVEKISVVNNGHRVLFIHDFDDNTTGIVDSERCFVMELSPELVLSPELLISGLTSGAPFDVSRVRSELRAALPALAELRRAAGEMAARCVGRPLYHLYQDDAIRKREAHESQEPHDYMQFSGRHLQEIKINNLQEVLAYERKLRA